MTEYVDRYKKDEHVVLDSQRRVVEKSLLMSKVGERGLWQKLPPPLFPLSLCYFSIMRYEGRSYLQLSMVDVRSGSPTRILVKDRFIQLCIIGWIATFAVILYL